MPYYIGFDVAFKPRGKIDENYSELRDFLNSNDLICYNFLETPITQESLSRYDILVFACPDFAKVSLQEITEIENWVRRDGGGLLLLSHAGGDRGRNSNLTEISEQFGMVFENDQVLDEENNIGMENMPVISTFNPPHPITEGIESLCYRAGCSLAIMGDAYSVANSNNTSDPFSCPLICVSEAENGRVCAIGSYELFRDRIGGGFQNDFHSQLALNVFKWLVSDYRTELRTGAVYSDPVAENTETSKTSTGPRPELGAGAPVDDRNINIDFSIKISNKTELVELLKIFQTQINTIKGTIDKLIETASASEDEIIELKQAHASQAAAVAAVNFDVPGVDFDVPGVDIDVPSADNAEKSSPATPPNDEDFKELFELKPVPLSALPPRPAALLNKPSETSENSIGLPEALIEEPVKSSEPEIEPTPEPEPKAKSNSKHDKNELEAEKDGLESKLNSVKNLITFINKKHDSGKLDDKGFKKQTNKLNKDLEKTNKRIKEIDDILKDL